MKGLMLLLGKSKAGSSDKEEPAGDDPKSSYGEELWSAIKDDDKAGFLAALDSYVSACKGGMPEEEEAEGEAPTGEE